MVLLSVIVYCVHTNTGADIVLTRDVHSATENLNLEHLLRCDVTIKHC